MIDLSIVVLYLIFTLVVGFLAGRGVKTMKDFSSSSKTFPTSVLVSTIFASCVGGDSLIGDTERAYSVGIIFLFLVLSPSINMLFTAYFVVPKMLRDFSEKISVGEIMESLYGKYGRLVCGISNMLFSLGFVAAQITSIGYVCHSFLGVSHFYGTIMGSLIVIAYSSFGGIRSVVITDAVQFGVLVVGIPLIASVALGKVGGFENLIASLPTDHLDIGPSHDLFYPYLFAAFTFMFPNFLPVDIQRILMSTTVNQAKISMIISSMLYIPFDIILAIIGLCAFCLFPGVEPNTVFFKVLNESLPVVIKGIAVSGVLAVIMSTADSFLNSSAISAIDDVAPILAGKEISDRTKLKLARLITAVFGIASIYIAMGNFDNLMEFLFYFFNFWMPIVAAPMFLYVFNFVTDVKTYLWSVVIGFSILLLYRYLVPEDYGIASQFVGMMATFFFMIILGKFNGSLRHFSAKNLAVSGR